MVKRIQVIDIAKGMSILFVALFHTHLCRDYPSLLDPSTLFRMPLFFFLSGVFFSYAKAARPFLFKITDALLKPYFFVSFCIFIVHVSLNISPAPLAHFIGIFYGIGQTLPLGWGPCWFLTHLFAIYCAVYLLFKYAHLARFSTFALTLVSLSIILLWPFFHSLLPKINIGFYRELASLPALPFSLDLLPFSAGYFLLGFLLKDAVKKFHPSNLQLTLSTGTFLLIALFAHIKLDLNSRIFQNPLLSMLGGLSGIYLMLCIAYFANKSRYFTAFFCLFGRASLFILLFHFFIYAKLSAYLLAKFSAQIHSVVIYLIAYLFAISIPLLIRYIAMKNMVLAKAFFPLSATKQGTEVSMQK